MRTVTILGITGSIGRTALRGIRDFRDRIRIYAASCNSRIDEALTICRKNSIPNLCITSETQAYRDGQLLDGVRIWKDLRDMLSEVPTDMVLNGIAGSAGLEASFWAIESGSDLALSNKESVVLGGNLLFRKAEKHDVKIIPVDSEHSAIDELILGCGKDNVEKLVITASGGPFRDRPLEELDLITPEQAANHPTWNMGPKISIDSSTLANKGLEVIEAHYLFGFDADHIEVVIHPQSIVHSMIRAKSGQVYAQLSPPDMVFPIMRALLWPTVDRRVGNALDFTNLDLTFRKLDSERFPFVPDAFECIRLEGSYPIAYNTANEVAVARFRSNQLAYTQIQTTVHEVLDLDWSYTPRSLEDILDVQNQVIRKMESK